MRKFGYLGKENYGKNAKGYSRSQWDDCGSLYEEQWQPMKIQKKPSMEATGSRSDLTSPQEFEVDRWGIDWSKWRVISIQWDKTCAIVPHDAEIWVPWR